MKVISNKPKGQRIFKSTHKTRPLWIHPQNDLNLWFDLNTGEWVNIKTKGYVNKSSAYYAMEGEGYKSIWSIKAAIRKIRKWDVPKGTIFYVGLPWQKYYFLITK